ncbi:MULTISPECIES: gamma-glutamyltransferase [unclassified Sphingomonas]|jgi:gamma-glutamyltranspeptidase/glutathione hydrolase|uniref:gamma-glutamyltransferase n=1 Tax=unclassified Sphingomonas TaxID=196159 RepID=UPI000830F3FA|nr:MULTISPECIES: gamma-glutamyltransferase [unclassified Sphingomonas]
MIRLFVALLALFVATPATAQGVVASADPRATEAGRDILRQGGTAADAAMAMMLALTVVEPQSSGFGGGGFIIHHGGKTGLLESIDGREKAPAAARPDRFLTPDGKPMGFRQAVPGGLSVGVPGNIRLAAMTHAKWGKLEWRALFQPAIKLAEDGFEVTKPLNGAAGYFPELWKNFPDIAALYLGPDGKPLPVGTRIRNPALAKFLRDIAEGGPDAFYTGPNAQAIVDAVTKAPANPADMTLADLAAYQAKERPPVCGGYRGYTVCGMGPPSSGAITILQMLGMIERFDLNRLGPKSPVAWHVLGEAMQLAYADREMYLGDRDFVDVPIAGLIDPGYLGKRSKLIAERRALNDYQPGTPPGARPRTLAVQAETPGTTHFVAVDRDGNIASMTSTVEGPFGSQLIANGLVLNNELTDFTYVPERDGAPVANRVEGGKRPLSSMSPTIVYDRAGKPVLALGSAGGKRIIMHVMKTLVGVLDFGLSAEEAMALPNLYFGGGKLLIEDNELGKQLAPEIARLGQDTQASDLGSKLTVLQRGPDGWRGAADPRSIGTALTE